MKPKKYPFSAVLVRLEESVLGPRVESLPESDTSHAQCGESKGGSGYGNELHVNVWDFESEAILDIGLLIHKKEMCKKIFIDIPWHLKKENIFDIATKIDGERILKAVFNRDVGYISSESKNPKVAFPDEPEKGFFLVRLNSTAFEIKDTTLPGGTEVSSIEIKLPESIDEDFKKHKTTSRFYVRFRLIDVPKEVFSTNFAQKDRNLLSSSVQTTVYDCRLNTRRGVPEEILSPTSAKLGFPEFHQMHLFLVVHRDREPTFQGHSFKACRSLEDENVWNEYIRLDGETSDHHVEEVKNYLGYQWTAKERDKVLAKELVALARFTRVLTDRWVMIRFILIALLLGASGSGIWTLVLRYAEASHRWYLVNDNEWSGVLRLLISAVILSLIPEKFFKGISKMIKRTAKKICKRFCFRG